MMPYICLRFNKQSILMLRW